MAPVPEPSQKGLPLLRPLPVAVYCRVEEVPLLPYSSGIFCVGPQLRGNVFFTDSNGAATVTTFKGSAFGANAEPAGSTTYYQYWFRDPGNTCQNLPGDSAAFNFSNGVEVDWLN